MRLLQWMLITGLGLLCCGCSVSTSIDTQSPHSFFNDANELKERTAEVSAAKKAWTELTTDTKTGLAKDATDLDLQRGRDRVQDAELGLVDAYFVEYEKALSNGRTSLDLILDVGSLIASGASTAAGGKADKTVLSGVATFISGAKLAVDEDLFFKTTNSALVAEMHALQSQQRLSIETRRQGAKAKNDYSLYTLGQAEADVKTYYEDGTIANAVAGINEQAKTTQAKANAERTSLIQGSFKPDANSDTLSAWLQGGADAAANARRLAALNAWIQARPELGNPSRTSFVNLPQFATQRAQAAKELTPTNP